ncbi:hypothetical protein AB0M02_28570 [Actinoplanes sp. NPDC051861]|uniref:hypothetical protein n=1 Tax=Actinoplanes sp. NPDC051861 TaxID=3155170 RepID=UPI003447AC77
MTRDFPADPAEATEVLRAELPGWTVTHSGRPPIYRAVRTRANGHSTVEAPHPAVVASTIETYFDEVSS